MAIPKILHQIYFQGWGALPEETMRSIEKMREENSQWQYRFYDDAKAESFIRSRFGDRIFDLYSSIDPIYYAARADLLRYMLCYSDGGVYLDVKSVAMRPLDSVLEKSDEYLLSQWPELRHRSKGEGRHSELSHIAGDEYVQWFIASAPKHPFLSSVIEAVTNNIKRYRPLYDGVGRKGVLRLTGPIAYTLAIEPLRRDHSHRYVDFDTDLGFAFSIHGDFKQHRLEYGKHYSTLTRPIVQTNAMARGACAAWYGSLQPTWRRQRDRTSKFLQKLGF